MPADVRCWACDAELHLAPAPEAAPAEPGQAASAPPSPLPPSAGQATPIPLELTPQPAAFEWLTSGWASFLGYGCVIVPVCVFLGVVIGHLLGGTDNEMGGAVAGLLVGCLLVAVWRLAQGIAWGARLLENLRREGGPVGRRAAPTACMFLGAAIGFFTYDGLGLVLGGAMGLLTGSLLHIAWGRAQSIPWVAQLFRKPPRGGGAGTGAPPPPPGTR